MQDLIDPEDFPFTEDEVYRAERLLSPEADARRMAADIASSGREAQAARIAAAAARARGSRIPTEINPPVMILSGMYFAQLAAVSPELEERVERYRLAGRAQARPSRLRNAMFRAGLPLGHDPTPEVLSKLAAEDAAEDAAWFSLRADLAAEFAEAQSLPRHLTFRCC
jgi:hypothetical protein